MFFFFVETSQLRHFFRITRSSKPTRFHNLSLYSCSCLNRLDDVRNVSICFYFPSVNSHLLLCVFLCWGLHASLINPCGFGEFLIVVFYPQAPVKDKESPAQVKATLLKPSAHYEGITVFSDNILFLFVFMSCVTLSVTLEQIQIFDPGELGFLHLNSHFKVTMNQIKTR